MKEKISKNIQLLDKKLQERILAFREFEASYINAQLIGDKKKILNIGCLWGRDYYFLKCLGKEIYNFDLGDQKLPNMNIGDISKRTKFKDKEFDAILIGEVIEHLFEDVNALKEIRRILKDDGKLILSVPYFDDDLAEFHVRMHSKNSIIRLLDYTGFKAEKHLFRGGVISIPLITSFLKIIAKISPPLRMNILFFLAKLDFKLGERNYWFFKFSRSYGGYLLANKGRKIDFVKINKVCFVDNRD